MPEDKGIPIGNLYYMLAYAFRELRQDGYRDMATEKFAHLHDLFAALLSRGVSLLLKRGLQCGYVERKEACVAPRGRIALTESLRQAARCKRSLVCSFAVLSKDEQMNRVLKTTVRYLLTCGEVGGKRRTDLKRLLLYFTEISEMRPESIVWSALRFHRGNALYRLPMQLCRLVLSGLLFTTKRGEQRLAAFFDEQSMARLYEKFLLAYYKCHHPALRARATQIPWLLDEEEDTHSFPLPLPRMYCDLMLSCGGKTLIIDAKYYGRMTRFRPEYGSRSLYSEHLYQIFAYVKNKDVKGDGSVAGMLLYAKTGETVVPDQACSLCGSRIFVRALDLSEDFGKIRRQLDEIAHWLQISAGQTPGFG